jgi:hypothetical protein
MRPRPAGAEHIGAPCDLGICGIRPLAAARGALIAVLGQLIAMLTAQNADLVLLADTALSTSNPASGPRSRILTPRTIEDKF